MSEDRTRYAQASASSARTDASGEATHASSSSRLQSDSAIDVSLASKLYYPCFGKVDLQSYAQARMYGLSFRRLHDEWVVLGKPRIDTSHWPRMVGHGGLPTSPEDFINVAEYYDRRLFSQVVLEAQGKPANRERPMDDFIISMVTTAAVVTADFVVYRLVRDHPSVEEALAQCTWHQHFTTFLEDSIRHFCNERKVCDRLGTHNCVLPLMFGQAHSMSLPTLLEMFDYQVQLFQNLFPNFGEHISRCAAARPGQPWSPPSGAPSLYARSMDTSSDPNSNQYDRASTDLAHASSANPMLIRQPRRSQYEGRERSFGTAQGGSDESQEPRASQRLTVAVVPSEVKRRDDLFAASIDSAIRCDVPLDKVVDLIDSKLSLSTSTSASSASTPLSMTTTAPLHAAQHNSAVSSQTSMPSSDAEWPQRRRDASDMSAGGHEVAIDSTNLTLRPPLHSHASWSGGVPGRSTSEEHNTVTPEEALAEHQGRAHSNSAYSYFSSLPTTPTELISPNSLLTSHDGSHPYTDRRNYRSNSGVLPMTSSSDPDSRKRTRAEQNREKMKAYHRRVMQQREALTGVLTDMSAHVGSIPMLSARIGAGTLLGSMGGDTSASAGLMEGGPGPGTMSSFGRSSQEHSWSVSLRNKQKQESKARLRKREIDQVHELGLYASYATATLSRSTGDNTQGSSFSRNRAEDETSGSATPWRQLHGHQVSEADVHMSQAILRVFMRHRPNWIALISAEQRLATEVAKLSPRTEDERTLQDGIRDRGSASTTGKGVKALIDRIQMGERAGTLAIPAASSTPLLPGTSLYDHQNHLARQGAGMDVQGSNTGGGGSRSLRLSAAPHLAGPDTYSQAGLTGAGPMMVSPGAPDYGAAVSPSGVTRPMSVDEGADYFGQDKRRYGGRYSDGRPPEASVMAAPMQGGYNSEQASAPFVRMEPPGAHRSGDGTSGLAPSVLSASSPYGGYNALYAGQGSQQRMGMQEMERQAQVSMGGMQSGQSTSSMPGMQLRVSTPYDTRAFATSIGPAATASRVEAAPALYHTQTLQTHPYAYSASGQQAAGDAQQVHGLQATPLPPSSSSMLQYRTSQPPSPPYPHNAYGQPGPYGGSQ